MPRGAPHRAGLWASVGLRCLASVADPTDCLVWSGVVGCFLPALHRVCKQNHWTSELGRSSEFLVHPFLTLKLRKPLPRGAVNCQRYYSWAVKEAVWLLNQCSSLHLAGFPVRFSFLYPPEAMVVAVWKD